MEVLSIEQTIKHLKWYEEALNNELATYEYITKDFNGHYPGRPRNDELKAGLGFGMALTAFSALDLLAYLLFGGDFSGGFNSDNFERLLTHKLFKDSFNEVNHKIFYRVLRCGMVHQLMPKGSVGLQARADIDDLLIPEKHPEHYALNTFYLLKATVNGYTNFIKDVELLFNEKNLLSEYNSKIESIKNLIQKVGKTEEEIEIIESRKYFEDKIKASDKAGLTLFSLSIKLTALIINDRSTFLQAFEEKIAYNLKNGSASLFANS